MLDVRRTTRTLPWREAAKDSHDLRPWLLEQLRREDFRGRRVLDVGTGRGRLAFVVARLGARVTGVDIDEAKLAHARAYAGVTDLRAVEFVAADAEETPYDAFPGAPFDGVVSNLCMSPAIIWRSSQALRPGGRLIFCCHHSDHWRETGRGSRFSFASDAMEGLLSENRFGVEFMGVETTVVVFETLRDVELYLEDRLIRRWIEDGRWEALADSFSRGERHLTESYLIVTATRVARRP